MNITKIYNITTTSHGKSSMSTFLSIRWRLQLDPALHSYGKLRHGLPMFRHLRAVAWYQQNDVFFLGGGNKIFTQNADASVFLFEFGLLKLSLGEEKGPIYFCFWDIFIWWYRWHVQRWWFHRKQTHKKTCHFLGEFDFCHPKNNSWTFWILAKDCRNVAHGKDRRKLSPNWKYQHDCIRYLSLRKTFQSNFNVIRGFYPVLSKTTFELAFHTQQTSKTTHSPLTKTSQ